MVQHVIRNSIGQVTSQGSDLFGTFCEQHHRCKVYWGDHYRVMKRRRDPTSLVLKCNKHRCTLHRDPPLTHSI